MEFTFTLSDGKVKKCGLETLIYRGFDGYFYVQSLCEDKKGVFHLGLPEGMKRTVSNKELATREDRRLFFLGDIWNYVVGIKKA